MNLLEGAGKKPESSIFGQNLKIWYQKFNDLQTPKSSKTLEKATLRQNPRVYLWNKPPQRKSLFSGVVGAKDVPPIPMTGWARGRSYEQRMDVTHQTGQHCQQCGTTQTPLMVHHPNRLGKRRQNKQGPANVIASGAEQRVKLLCPACHKQHHRGRCYT